MKRIISTATAAGLLAGALMVPAILRAEDKAAEKGGKHGFAERIREKLGITEEQGAKLKAARRARRDASEAIKSDLKAGVRKLHDQLEDKAPEKDIAATLEKLSASRKALRAEEDKFEAATASILTPTQRAKMVVGMAHGMRGGRGRGPGKGWGKGGKGGDAEEHDGPDRDDD
jgi:Spy/CpxP family protein refolding chaperone